MENTQKIELSEIDITKIRTAIVHYANKNIVKFPFYGEEFYELEYKFLDYVQELEHRLFLIQKFALDTQSKYWDKDDLYKYMDKMINIAKGIYNVQQ